MLSHNKNFPDHFTKEANPNALMTTKKVKQVGSLYTSMFFGLIIGMVVSIINTRLLGPEQYGDFKFLQTLFSFFTIISTFGFFVSGSNLLANIDACREKVDLIGNLLLLATVVSLFMTLLVFLFSFFNNKLFNNNLENIIRLFCPLLFVFPFQTCLENILQGDNRIYSLSALRAGPGFLYIAISLIFNYVVPLSLVSALAINFLSVALLLTIIIFFLKPKFANVKKNISSLLDRNKHYGFQVYLGSLCAVASAHLGGLSLAYFVDNKNVGFFSLALTITMPLSMIPSAVGTTLYKDFAKKPSIPRDATSVALCFSGLGLVLFFLLIKKAIIFLYSDQYISVLPLTYLLSFGSVLHGFGDYINRFLGAHGKGSELRNAAVAVGFTNVFGYTILVFALGIQGAAITKTISSLIYLTLMLRSYKKITSRKLSFSEFALLD